MVSLVLANLKALQAWALRAEEWALESPKPTTSNGTSTTNNSKSNDVNKQKEHPRSELQAGKQKQKQETGFYSS